jgi:hypothetical protein
MARGNIKHRGPAQTRVLDNDVVLLRKLDVRRMGSALMEILYRTRLGGDIKEGDQDWFLDGYVAADQPRDAAMSQAIAENTIGFAIARSDNGEILATFPKNEFRRADEIARTARVELAVDIAMREFDDEGDEDSANEQSTR